MFWTLSSWQGPPSVATAGCMVRRCRCSSCAHNDNTHNNKHNTTHNDNINMNNHTYNDNDNDNNTE